MLVRPRTARGNSARGRACCSVGGRPLPTARGPGLLVRPRTARANGKRARPADPSADGQGQRRAGRSCWSVRRRPRSAARGPGLCTVHRRSGPTAPGSGLLVRPRTARANGARAGHPDPIQGGHGHQAGPVLEQDFIREYSMRRSRVGVSGWFHCPSKFDRLTDLYHIRSRYTRCIISYDLEVCNTNNAYIKRNSHHL